MNAVEYFKKHGYKKCKSAVQHNGWLNTSFWVSLKRLVESYELVESYGGLNRSRFYVDLLPFTPAGISRSTLKQAIADVEKCQ